MTEEKSLLQARIDPGLKKAFAERYPKRQAVIISKLLREHLGWGISEKEHRLKEIKLEISDLQIEKEEIEQEISLMWEKKVNFINEKYTKWNIIQPTWENDFSIVPGGEEFGITYHDIWLVKTGAV